jgi:GT2 family glycosyltransferase
MNGRPAVSVIVPFAGSEAQLTSLLAELQRLERNPDDELIVADNRATEPGRQAAGEVRVVPAPEVRAAGYARNCAASVASGEWLVFIDSDTHPRESLLDDYFDPPPGPATAVLAGGIVDVVPDGAGTAARHSARRAQMSHRVTLARPGTPYAQSGNCAVRASAFGAIGGFSELIRAGEDADLCFRLAEAGWQLEERPRASVEHPAPGSVRALLTQLASHGSGAAWLNDRYPTEFPPPRPRELAGRVVRCGRDALAALARGDREPAVMALLDLVTISAVDVGRLRSNRARRRPSI